MILYFDLTYHIAGVYKTESRNEIVNDRNRKRQRCKNSKEFKCGFGCKLTKVRVRKNKKTKTKKKKKEKKRKRKKEMCNLGPSISNHDT